MVALKFGVVLQRPTFGQCFFLPAFVVKSFAAAQQTFDLNSFSERNRIIVPVQLFATKFAATRANLCWLLHVGSSCVGNVTSIEAFEGGTRAAQHKEVGRVKKLLIQQKGHNFSIWSLGFGQFEHFGLVCDRKTATREKVKQQKVITIWIGNRCTWGVKKCTRYNKTLII